MLFCVQTRKLRAVKAKTKNEKTKTCQPQLSLTDRVCMCVFSRPVHPLQSTILYTAAAACNNAVLSAPRTPFFLACRALVYDCDSAATAAAGLPARGCGGIDPPSHDEAVERGQGSAPGALRHPHHSRQVRPRAQALSRWWCIHFWRAIVAPSLGKC